MVLDAINLDDGGNRNFHMIFILFPSSHKEIEVAKRFLFGSIGIGLHGVEDRK